MKKVTCWLVLPMLCMAGCIRIDTRTKAHVNDDRIEVTATGIEVSQAIDQLIAARGWTSEGGGARTVSTSSVRTGFRVSTRDGVQLPEKRRSESAETWIYARTETGKVVHFEISQTDGRLFAIRVGVEDGAPVSEAEVAADLAQRLHVPAQPRHPKRGPLTIQLDPFGKSPTDPNAYTAHWAARGDWPYPAEYVQFEVRGEDRGSRSYSIHIASPTTWSVLEGDSTPESTRVRLARPAGVLVLEGQQSAADGVATLEPNATYVAELTRIVRTPPGMSELLELFFRPIALDSARQMKQVLADELTLLNLLRLSSYHVSADYVQGSRDAGYMFSVEQLVRLTNYHIPLETLRGFKQAGYSYSVEEFIRIHNYHLDVKDFTGFRDAGYDFSIDEMIRARNYHVPVEMVRTLHEAGLQYTLDEIIKLRNYHVSPEDIIAFRRAGYPLSVDDLIKAKNYHVDAQDAARFKQIGYDFSLDDLIKLHNHRVPTEFIIQLHHPDYENFTADELIGFHQKRMSAETINKIRAAKRKTPQ